MEISADALQLRLSGNTMRASARPRREFLFRAASRIEKLKIRYNVHNTAGGWEVEGATQERGKKICADARKFGKKIRNIGHWSWSAPPHQPNSAHAVARQFIVQTTPAAHNLTEDMRARARARCSTRRDGCSPRRVNTIIVA